MVAAILVAVVTLDLQESAGRRSAGAGSGGGLSSLTAAQLAEHYNNCIKLSAENKISAKNAFNLQLIDYMASMIKKKESDMDNFQVISNTNGRCNYFVFL